MPREYVHRAAVAEVLLTGWRAMGDDRFTVTAQWPRGHSFYGPVAGHYDPMLAAETIRQAGALLAHTAFGVPLDHKFLMWDLSYTFVGGPLRVGTAPADLELEVRCTEVKRRGTRLAGVRYEVTVRDGAWILAEGGASYTVASPEAYRRLRGARAAAVSEPAGRSAPPLPGSLVGRAREGDVVLSRTDTPGRLLLRVDLTHPVLFDHYVDHVPGMLLLEGARQAAYTAGSGARPLLPAGVRGAFQRYAELDTPTWLEVDTVDTTDRGHTVRVTGHQDGTTVFTATVGMVPAG